MSIEIPGLPEDMPGAELKYVGKDVKRIEDPGLVTGAVEFIDNLHTAQHGPLRHAAQSRIRMRASPVTTSVPRSLSPVWSL